MVKIQVKGSSAGSASKWGKVPVRGLTKPAKAEVKKLILKSKPMQICHNGASPTAQTTGNAVTPLVNFWQNVQTLTEINSGNTEYNRTGDQIKIYKIELRMYVNTTASNDIFRFAVLRQKSSGMTPLAINPNPVFQVPSPGVQGCITPIQDDTSVQVLTDRTYTLGIAAGMQEGRFIKLTLRNKRGWTVKYNDGTTAGTSLVTQEGDIALLATCLSGAVDLYYQYNIHFSEL